MKKKKESNRGINFQSFSNNGITTAFKRFLNINIDEMNKEKGILEEVISKRHRIIHGNLKDAEIDLREVKDARDALQKIVDFLHSKITMLENTNFAAGTIFI